jgi:hypothetical protein
MIESRIMTLHRSSRTKTSTSFEDKESMNMKYLERKKGK